MVKRMCEIHWGSGKDLIWIKWKMDVGRESFEIDDCAEKWSIPQCSILNGNNVWRSGGLGLVNGPGWYFMKNRRDLDYGWIQRSAQSLAVTAIPQSSVHINIFSCKMEKKYRSGKVDFPERQTNKWRSGARPDQTANIHVWLYDKKKNVWIGTQTQCRPPCNLRVIEHVIFC